MMPRSSIGLFLLPCLLFSPLPARANATDAFAFLQGLQGTWSIQSKGKMLLTEMTYAPGSKGSIVTEQFGRELSVFYLDGNTLLMTHFCNAGNQPRLRLLASGGPGVLEFDMIDITNLKTPASSHVYRIVYRPVDDRHFGLDIIWQTGADEDTEHYLLTRK